MPGGGVQYDAVVDAGGVAGVNVDLLMEGNTLIGDTQVEYFGNSVALEGDTAVVGADKADATQLVGRGAVYVFVEETDVRALLCLVDSEVTLVDDA